MPRAVLYITGEAIEDDDNVGGLGAGVAVRAAGQCALEPGEKARPGRLGVERPVPESACAQMPLRVSSRPTGSLLHARRVAGVTSDVGTVTQRHVADWLQRENHTLHGSRAPGPALPFALGGWPRALSASERGPEPAWPLVPEPPPKTVLRHEPAWGAASPLAVWRASFALWCYWKRFS